MMNFNHPLILGSKSPRRQYLLRELGIEFEVRPLETDESYPESLSPIEVAGYLAEKKALAYLPQLLANEWVLTADTVVKLGNEILGKPESKEHAQELLGKLSGKTHEVITGVCLMSLDQKIVFDDLTRVSFKPLSEEEINFYIDHYAPYDKAGAYGAQDWIGMVAVERIEGSYFNVMGLPIHLVYHVLSNIGS
jgi:septum formation protein